MNRFLDAKKALEAVVFVSRHTDDLFHIMKTLFYADKFHLAAHGRTITGDEYFAMKDGPVPSGAFDIVKFVRGDGTTFDQRIKAAHPEEAIEVKGRSTVRALRLPELDYLSESDVECLNEAVRKYAKMYWFFLWSQAHNEPAYRKTERNKKIPLKDIILSVPDGKEILEYLDS